MPYLGSVSSLLFLCFPSKAHHKPSMVEGPASLQRLAVIERVAEVNIVPGLQLVHDIALHHMCINPFYSSCRVQKHYN